MESLMSTRPSAWVVGRMDQTSFWPFQVKEVASVVVSVMLSAGAASAVSVVVEAAVVSLPAVEASVLDPQPVKAVSIMDTANSIARSFFIIIHSFPIYANAQASIETRNCFDVVILIRYSQIVK
jgi:hypothetical protein